jgi:hypothetical protein
VTDHKPLIGILSQVAVKPTARLERILLRLQTYKFKLIYKPGPENTADFLTMQPSKQSSNGKNGWKTRVRLFECNTNIYLCIVQTDNFIANDM